MKKIKKLKFEKINRGGIRLPEDIDICKKINEIIEKLNEEKAPTDASQ